MVAAVDCSALFFKLKHKAVITFAHLVRIYPSNERISLCRNKFICARDGINLKCNYKNHRYRPTGVFVAVHCMSETRGFCGSRGAAAQYHCEVFFSYNALSLFPPSHLPLVYKSQNRTLAPCLVPRATSPVQIPVPNSCWTSA